MRTLALLFLVTAIHADDTRDLRKGNSCDWNDLFRSGTVAVPCGKTLGTVLEADGLFPRFKARLQNIPWKGKSFHCEGVMINRWRGFEAVEASVSVGTSWYDGLPCVILQYPDDAKVFGGVRDEIRQISPGTWLGRCHDSHTGELKSYFMLRTQGP